MNKSQRIEHYKGHDDFNIIRTLIIAMPRTCQLAFIGRHDMFAWIDNVARRNHLDSVELAKTMADLLDQGILMRLPIIEGGPVLIGFKDTFYPSENEQKKNEALALLGGFL